MAGEGEGFKIADGFVNVHGEVDKASIRRAATEAGQEAGETIARETDRTSRSEGRKRRGGFLREIFTPNEGLLRSLIHSWQVPLSSPIGALAGIVGLVFASSFIAAVGSILISALPPVLFGALAVAILHSNKKVQAALDSTVKTITGVFQRAAQPMVAPIVGALGMVGQVAKELEPQFHGIFENLSQIVETATNGALGFIRNLVTAFDEQMPAFNSIFTVLSNELPRLGEYIGRFFKVFADNKEAISAAIGPAISIIGNLLIVFAELLVFLTKLFVGFVTTWHKIQDASAALAAWFTGPFVNFFKAVGSALKAAWDATVSAIKTALNAVRSAAQTVVDWFRGPFVSFFVNAWNTVRNTVSAGVSAVVSFFTGLPGRAQSALASLWSRMSGAFSSAVSNAKAKASELVSGAIGIIAGLPGKAGTELGKIKGKVTGAFAGAGSWLYNAGKEIIQGLINGVSDKLGALRDKMSSVASTIRDHLPFSPAKVGPLSGKGSPLLSGRKIASMVAEGIGSGTPKVFEAARAMTGAVSAPVPVSTSTSTVTHGPTYTFAPGSIVIDASKLKSIQDVVDLVGNITSTARQFGSRAATTAGTGVRL